MKLWVRIPINGSYIPFVDIFELGLFEELELKPEMSNRELGS